MEKKEFLSVGSPVVEVMHRLPKFIQGRLRCYGYDNTLHVISNKTKWRTQNCAGTLKVCIKGQIPSKNTPNIWILVISNSVLSFINFHHKKMLSVNFKASFDIGVFSSDTRQLSSTSRLSNHITLTVTGASRLENQTGNRMDEM